MLYLTISRPGFWARHSPGEGGRGAKSAPHHNVFVIGRIMMKLGKFVLCYIKALTIDGVLVG